MPWIFRIFLGVMGLVGVTLAGADPVATITYLDGDVSLIRDGQTIPSYAIQEGFGIEDYDTITTGDQSHVEISFNPATGIAGTLKMGSGSTIWIELSALLQQQTAGINLLVGSLQVKVDKMFGKAGFQVRTDAAVMGVRGTQFHVDSSPQGDFLVATLEGRVECSSNGRTLFAVPGSVVEVLPEEQLFHSVPVDVATVDSFEKSWYKQRVAALKANAPQAFVEFARRYQQEMSQLSRAEERIKNDAGSVLSLWKKQDATGNLSAGPDLLIEKNTVIGPLLQAKTPMFFLERLNYRLKEMKSYLKEGALSATVELSSGYTAKDFFRQWDQDQASLLAWMSDYRYDMKLFAERNNGSFPTDFTSQPEFTRSSDFFN
ncbi:MAG: FecR domain-containing protein [Spirochaetales bacterium]|nr:FecR domain-containing protein [Spirochaetales bacterium]